MNNSENGGGETQKKASSKLYKPPSGATGVRKYGVREVAEVLSSVGGNQAAAARVLGVDRSTVHRYVLRHPTLSEIVLQARESVVDRAEQGLANAVDKEDPWAVKFTLATIGRDRGYSEQAEGTQVGITIDLRQAVQVRAMDTDSTASQAIPTTYEDAGTDEDRSE